MSSAAPAAPAKSESLRRSVETISQLLFASGVVTAILYYFGYVRERELFSYFGVPIGALDFTTSDYVLRSAQAVFAPLLTLFLLATVGLAVHEVVMTRRGDLSGQGWRLGWVTAAGTALALLCVGAIGAFAHSLIAGPVLSAIALGTGALLMDYSAWMASVDAELPTPVHEALDRSRLPRRMLLTALAVLAAFWWTLNVATANGRAAAQAIQRSLEWRGEAVVLTDARLAISGHGLTIEPVAPQPSRYAYRYEGFRVLLHTGDQWILLPRGWTPENGDSVVLLPETAAAVRVEVRP